MKNYFNLFYLLIIVVFITSCNRKAYFTSDVRNKIESKNIDLKKLQYYIDNDVVLSREISSDTARVTAGRVVFQNGKYYETIILRANTKGVCTGVYPNRLNLAFETGNNKNITFTIPQIIGSQDVYQMVNEDIYGNASTIIKYEGQIYNLVPKNGYLPRLMIRKRLVEKEDRIDRVMKGVKVQ